jgi:SIR2-like domain
MSEFEEGTEYEVEDDLADSIYYEVEDDLSEFVPAAADSEHTIPSDLTMARVVFLLGAGFNCSILDPTRGKAAPLARDFFRVLIEHGDFESRLEAIRSRIYVDVLLDQIQRYWHLDLEGLRSQPFDIEECMTLLESQLRETMDDAHRVDLLRALFALRQLLLMYLGDLSFDAYTPTARRFGLEVLTTSADVLTFNYDTLAEEAIASASGIGPKPSPDSLRGMPGDVKLSDEDLDASHLAWRSSLAYGFGFDEVTLPVAGIPPQVDGSRYYSHPNNQLYDSTRVLKLHGSIDWLRYTDSRVYPLPDESPAPTKGIVLERHSHYWMGESPTKGPWRMEPVIIPPLLYKDFREHPFPSVWNAALDSLRECETLIVVGYSFPPTDFRTRRLFLEAFSGHAPTSVVVINPDPAVAGAVRHLTHFKGAVMTCDNLPSLYGLPGSWFSA